MIHGIQTKFDQLKNKTDDQAELEFKKYERRMQNYILIFKACAIYIIQMILVYEMILYYHQAQEAGGEWMHDGGPFSYGNISLKFLCSLILHLMM